MDLIDAIKKQALLASIEPDSDAVLRRLYRWFSKTFHMSIADVEDLPTDYILLHYYESKYEDLEDEEKHDEIIDILETPEEKELRINSFNKAEDDFMAELEEQAKKQRVDEIKTKKEEMLSNALKPKPLSDKELEENPIKIEYVESLD